MRDVKRIPKIMARLERVWKRTDTDYRLAQLIGNVYHIPSGDDPYYIEDEEFIATMEKYYGVQSKERPHKKRQSGNRTKPTKTVG